MALRRFKKDAFIEILKIQYGCALEREFPSSYGFISPSGESFSVPKTDDEFYPEYLMDTIISDNSLKLLVKPMLKIV